MSSGKMHQNVHKNIMYINCGGKLYNHRPGRLREVGAVEKDMRMGWGECQRSQEISARGGTVVRKIALDTFH